METLKVRSARSRRYRCRTRPCAELRAGRQAARPVCRCSWMDPVMAMARRPRGGQTTCGDPVGLSCSRERAPQRQRHGRRDVGERWLVRSERTGGPKSRSPSGRSSRAPAPRSERTTAATWERAASSRPAEPARPGLSAFQRTARATRPAVYPNRRVYYEPELSSTTVLAASASALILLSVAQLFDHARHPQAMLLRTRAKACSLPSTREAARTCRATRPCVSHRAIGIEVADGECEPSGGEPSGSANPQKPVTFCCK